MLQNVAKSNSNWSKCYKMFAGGKSWRLLERKISPTIFRGHFCINYHILLITLGKLAKPIAPLVHTFCAALLHCTEWLENFLQDILYILYILYCTMSCSYIHATLSFCTVKNVVLLHWTECCNSAMNRMLQFCTVKNVVLLHCTECYNSAL